MASWVNQLGSELRGKQQRSALRTRVSSSSPCGANIKIKDRVYANFSSNDYLGLADHPALKKAAIDAIDKYGVGAGASPLVTGYNVEYEQLEEALAEFTQREAAIVFGSGFKANNAVLETLLGKNDCLYQDKLNHASLIDGGRYCGAKMQRYRHVDTAHLETLLLKNQPKDAESRRQLIVSDSVFSMDGDIAPVKSLAALSKKYDAALMLDDAHGFGVLGEKGAGIVEHVNLSQKELPVLMATLGKAFGVSGAFVAGSRELVDTLVDGARNYIYSTAMPPALAAAARASLKIVQEEPQRREHLRALIAHFKKRAHGMGFSLAPSDTAIQILVVGENALALKISEDLRERGYWITAIRPPTVPPKTARLRITLSAAHTIEQVDGMLAALEDVVKRLAIDPATLGEGDDVSD